MNRRNLLKLTSIALVGAATFPSVAEVRTRRSNQGLWSVWDDSLAQAKFISLSHVLTQDSPVWEGFPKTTRFQRGIGRLEDKAPYAPFTYEQTGVETTSYVFATDQFGTQLDPPAHWHQCFPAIDELPPTLALRKLAVISIVDKVQDNPSHQLTIDDITDWERTTRWCPPMANSRGYLSMRSSCFISIERSSSTDMRHWTLITRRRS
jgi:hypothetical protein